VGSGGIEWYACGRKWEILERGSLPQTWDGKAEIYPCIVRLWECDGAGVLSSVLIKERNTDFGAVFTVECAKVRASYRTLN
jgi:hypothetical protein